MVRRERGSRYPVAGDYSSLLEAAVERGDVPPVVLVGVACGTAAGRDMRSDEYLLGFHPERFDTHRRFFVSDVATFAESELGVVNRVSPAIHLRRLQRSRLRCRHGPPASGTVWTGARLSLGMPPTASWPPGGVPGHYLLAGTLEEGFRRSTANWADTVRAAGGDCIHVEMVSGHDFRMWELQCPLALAWATANAQ